MDKYRAAVLQLDCQNDREDNLDKIAKAVEQAAACGAKLVVLPETVDYIGQDMACHAWTLQEAEQFFGTLAKKYNLYMHCGSITLILNGRKGKPYNTTLFFGPDGVCMCQYRKVHMFDVDVEQEPVFRESEEIQAGSRLLLAQTRLGVIGFAICYDIRFGEMFRLMAQAGAQLYCVCACFTAETGRAHWETLLRTRAIENGCYVLAANQTGTKPAFEAYGNSMIINPWGDVIAHADNREEILYAEIDRNEVTAVRKQIPSLRNIRKDVYQLEGSVEIVAEVR